MFLFLFTGDTSFFFHVCHFLIFTPLLEIFYAALQTRGSFLVPFKCKWLCVKTDSRAEYERGKKCTCLSLFFFFLQAFFSVAPWPLFIPQTFSQSHFGVKLTTKTQNSLWLLIKKIWFIYQIVYYQIILLFFPLTSSSILFLKLVKNNFFLKNIFHKGSSKESPIKCLNLSNTEFRIFYFYFYLILALSFFHILELNQCTLF